MYMSYIHVSLYKTNHNLDNRKKNTKRLGLKTYIRIHTDSHLFSFDKNQGLDRKCMVNHATRFAPPQSLLGILLRNSALAC